MMRLIGIMTISILVVGCSSRHYQQRPQEIFYPNGTVKSVLIHWGGQSNKIKWIFREDGSLESVIEYDSRKIHGFKNTYYPGGSFWRKELYEHGKLVEMIEYDEQGHITLEIQNY